MSELTNLAKALEGKSAKEIEKALNSTISKPVSDPGGSRAAAQLEVKMKEHGFTKSDASCEFKGSKQNQQIVKGAILEKYGADEVSKYRPAGNVCPRTEWNKRGFYVPEEEEPLCFITTYRNSQQKRIALFHANQVSKG